MTTLFWVAAILMIMIGVVGTVLPALPGAPFIFLGALLAGWIDHFARIGWPSLTALGILAACSVCVDFIAAARGAKRFGASKLAVVGATIGTLFGLFLGIIGVLIGPFCGALIGELISKGDFEQAGKVGFATWLGLLIGAVVKLALAFSMIGILIAAYFIG
jgi:uncharacterized protein YqgC (DUF456 family)